jgi:hypothetical protein
MGMRTLVTKSLMDFVAAASLGNMFLMGPVRDTFFLIFTFLVL